MITTNDTQRLYIIPCGSGFSCLGFDVCEKRIAALIADGLTPPASPAPIGTPERYAQLESLYAQAAERYRTAGRKSSAELTPELIGLEGKRVEVTHQYHDAAPEKTRFHVGRSAGYVPCHLQIARRNCHGGQSVCLGKIISVRVIA